MSLSLFSSQGLAQLDIDITLNELAIAARRYVDELGLDAADVVRRTFRLVVRDVMSITAPNSYAQGRKATARDINRAIYLMDPNKVTHWPELRQAILAGDKTKVKWILQNSKKGRWSKVRDVVDFDPNYHTSVRDKRGRVQHSKWIVTLDKPAHQRYVRMRQGHVGHLRSGFMPGARLAGLSVPSWVARHSPPGTVADRTGSADPEIQMDHDSKATPNINRTSIDRVIRKRAATMHRDVDQILRGRPSRYFNGVIVPGQVP
jgi:hypothetical protein